MRSTYMESWQLCSSEQTSQSKAPSSRIRMFLNPELFLSGLKISPSTRQRIQIKFACPHASDVIRIHSSTQGSSAMKCLQNMRNRNYSYTLCRHIVLQFGKRPDMIVLRHRIEKYPDLPVHTSSDSLRTLESGFKNVRIRLIAVEFAGCVWTEAVSGKKKYPDMCGRGLRWLIQLP